MQARLETGVYVIGDDHLKINNTEITVTNGYYDTPADLCDQIELDFDSYGFSGIAVSDDAVFSATTHFELTWQNDELRDYLGFSQDSYYSTQTLSPDATMSGRFEPSGWSWDLSVRLKREGSQSHTGRPSYVLLAVQEGIVLDLWILESEYEHWRDFVNRVAAGHKVAFSRSNTESGSFSWSSNSDAARYFEAERSMDIGDPVGEVDTVRNAKLGLWEVDA